MKDVNIEKLIALFFEDPKKAVWSYNDNGTDCTAGVSYGGKSSSALAGGNAETRILRAVYKAAGEVSGIRPPWGVLTGIRPDFILRRLYDSGLSVTEAREKMRRDYLVRDDKITLCEYTAKAYRNFASSDKKDVDVYIGVPFCPTRCSYCSFISHDAVSMRKLEGEYTKKLCREIEVTSEILHSAGLTVRTVYIGGGTPTSLSEENLDALLSAVEGYLSGECAEFCVEGGRPDTLTRAKLERIFRAGADRICINPQTANNETLKKIGRAHTWGDFCDKFALARSVGFKNINSDLIAGLDGEDLNDFKRSLDSLLSLSPEGVTVHALYVKRGSAAGGEIHPYSNDAEEMMDYAVRRCADEKLFPYYLYRQKKTVSNLENIGFAKNGAECIFNIDTMGDTTSVIALGAGGVTKLVGSETVRYSNFKNADMYISRFDEILKRKKMITSILGNRNNL